MRCRWQVSQSSALRSRRRLGEIASISPDPRHPVIPFGPSIFPFLDHCSVLRLERNDRRAWVATRLTYDTISPRAVLLSPDEKTLYVADGEPREGQCRELRAYPLRGDGTLDHPIVLHAFPADRRGQHRGIEGMCLDADGNIVAVGGWQRSGPGPLVYVFTPDGAVTETHPIPADLPTNAASAGAISIFYRVTTAGVVLSGANRAGGFVEALGVQPVSFRDHVSVVVTLIALLLGDGAAQAQDYPSRLIRVVWSGLEDRIARLFGPKNIGNPGRAGRNRAHLPGAGGVIAAQTVATAQPDGYTLLLATASYTINTALGTSPYDLRKHFASIAHASISPFILIVHPSVPVKTVPELIALAKSKPGALNYASSGIGTPPHLAGELFKSMAGIDLVHVPFREANSALNAVVRALANDVSISSTTRRRSMRAPCALSA